MSSLKSCLTVVRDEPKQVIWLVDSAESRTLRWQKSSRKVSLHCDWSVSYRSEVKARQDVKPDIRQPPFTDYRQPPVDYRHPPVADYRQPPTLDYRHPPLLDYRQLTTDARQFTIPEYRMPPVQVSFSPTAPHG